MRRFKWAVALTLCLSLVLSGCGLLGKKDAGSVVRELDSIVNKLDSYHAEGTMTLNTGTEPQEYSVEVCYMAESYYRIALTNAKKDITQIVLRNDDGVFVLTPHLNKSFRFQSDWPENQGQVYLYQSLVQSILMDNERQFTTDDKSYVFDVAANYQNGSLARQKVWLDKKNYAPQHVEVSDTNNNVMVVVKFEKFEFGTKFEKDQFDMQRNMTGWDMKTLPTLGHDHEGDKAGAADTQGTDKAANGQATGDKAANGAQGSDSKANSGQAGSANGKTTDKSAAVGNTNKQQSFGIIEPNYIPSGVKKQDTTELKLGEEKAVMLRYSGKYNYSLIESRPQEKTVSILPGDILDLGFTLGVVTGDDKKTLTWTYDGVEFRLSTGDLPVTEMIKVAQAVQGEMGK
ncbi:MULTISPECIES: outer membrane lipoprotein-sorting protein [Paenibacillus]|uniref:Outer membrane lipoprotein carrier protein LolA n=1 Tax=Paenibacillus validus TaxID=44253 RepID=A0A7X2ZGQ3_9BACL|nr:MULTISPECIES: outer membrane lipoprotein-sorting protein [Paenibacillus]MUG73958.1 outer membrane lipoprotein carrier protein LolA [Paenibacillus validus]